MSKVIDSFLVALGIDLDEKSMNDANKSIEGIKTGALAIGAALASAMAAGGYATKRTAGEIDKLNNSAKLLTDVGVTELDKLGHAISVMGGDAGEAAPLLKNLESILTGYERLGDADAIEQIAKLGIPTEFITDAENSLELLRNIVELMPQLDPELQPRVADVFGMGTGAHRLAQEGVGNMDTLLRRAEELAKIDPQLVKASSELTASFEDLARANDGLFRQFTKGAAPGVTESINEWTEALAGMSEEAERLGNIFGFVSTMLSPDKVMPKKPANKDEELEFALFGSGYQRFLNFVPGYGPVAMGPRLIDLFSGDNPASPGAPSTPVENSSSATPYFSLPPGAGGSGLSEPGRSHYFPLLDAGPQATNLDYVDSIMPQSIVNNTNAGRSFRIDHLEMNINGSTNAKDTADEVMERINQSYDMARQQLQTATAG